MQNELYCKNSVYSNFATFDQKFCGLTTFSIQRSGIKGTNTFHHHDYNQIIYSFCAPFTHHYNGHTYIQDRGSMIFVPPMLTHNMDRLENSGEDICQIDFSDEFITNEVNSDSKDTLFNMLYLDPIIEKAQGCNPVLHFSGEKQDELEDLLMNMLCQYNINDQFTLPYIRASMTKLFHIVTDQYRQNTSAKQAQMHAEYRSSIQNALDYIYAHYTEQIYLKDICKIANMSPSRFEYIFKYIIGKTFSEYLVYLRILHARQMLMTTDKTLYDICRTCGFRSDTYFCRIFKKHTGLRPSAYRNAKFS